MQMQVNEGDFTILDAQGRVLTSWEPDDDRELCRIAGVEFYNRGAPWALLVGRALQSAASTTASKRLEGATLACPYRPGVFSLYHRGRGEYIDVACGCEGVPLAEVQGTIARLWGDDALDVNIAFDIQACDFSGASWDAQASVWIWGCCCDTLEELEADASTESCFDRSFEQHTLEVARAAMSLHQHEGLSFPGIVVAPPHSRSFDMGGVPAGSVALARSMASTQLFLDAAPVGRIPERLDVLRRIQLLCK